MKKLFLGVSDFSNFRFQFDFSANKIVESKLLYIIIIIYNEIYLHCSDFKNMDFQLTEI